MKVFYSFNRFFKTTSLFLLFLLVSSPVFAQLPDFDISPPSLPSENEVLLTLEMFDYLSKKPVNNIHARLSFSSKTDNFSNINTLKYIPENGKITISLPPDDWKLNILIDDILTPGKDYIYETYISLKNSLTEQIYLLPAGSIEGVVFIDNYAVPLARVFLYCSGLDDFKETVTESTGFFSFDWIPIGQCRIASVFNNKRGETSVTISKGAVSEANIDLTEGIFKSFKFLIYFIILIFCFCLICLIIFLFFKNKKLKKKINKKAGETNKKTDEKTDEKINKKTNKKNKNRRNKNLNNTLNQNSKKNLKTKNTLKKNTGEKNDNSKNKNTDEQNKTDEQTSSSENISRIDDIIKTLNSKEKAIVNFLLENNNHSSQSVIKNNLNIPKTTIIRILNGLESKNIIFIERIGKLKKIRLTEWFIGKK